MLELRDILDRFRPAPGPGRAGPLGVPSATVHTSADELQPVFAALDDVEACCAAIRENGERRTADIREAAEAALAAIWSRAAKESERIRAESAASVAASGRVRHAVELAAARQEAARIGTSGIEAMGPYVTAAVSRVRNIPSSLRTRDGGGDLP